MGRSAGESARVEAAGRVPVVPRVKAAPRPDTPAHTVREILPPWHLIEAQVKERQKRDQAVALGALVSPAPGALAALAAHEAESAQWLSADAVEEIETPPSSGVRVSDPRLGVATPIPDSLLTFKVYTLAELESREAPNSMGLSQASLDSPQARSVRRWKRVLAALQAFATATLAWWKTKQTEGFRPSPKIALREPFDALGDALQVAVDAVDWKKYGVTTGIVVGATFTLLFGVLTAAELTDDLKPGSAPHLATTELSAPRLPAAPAKPVAPASNMAALGVQPAPPPIVVIASDAEEPEAEPVPAKRAAKKAKPRTSNKLTFRNADAVFNP